MKPDILASLLLLVEFSHHRALWYVNCCLYSSGISFPAFPACVIVACPAQTYGFQFLMVAVNSHFADHWVPSDLGVLQGSGFPQPWAPLSPSMLLLNSKILWLGVGAHGWVARICQPWERSPSRSWLPIVEARGCLRHTTSICDAVVNYRY